MQGNKSAKLGFVVFLKECMIVWGTFFYSKYFFNEETNVMWANLENS